MPTLLLGLGGAALVLGCGGEQERPASGYTRVDSAGVEIVTSHRPAWGEAGVEEEPLLRIGREEEGPYQFGSIRFARFLDGGRIVVADGQANEVRVFDEEGTHLGTFGGSGEAPGEFGNIAALFDYRGDSLVVFDQRNYRTTVYSPSSGGFRTIRNEIPGNFVVFGRVPDGSFLLFNPGQFNPDLEPGLQWDSTDVVVMDPEGGASRTVARLPVFQRLIGPGASRESLIPAHTSVRAAASDGFYWATSDRYEIRLYGADGGARRILRRPVDPRRVDQPLIDEYVRGYLEWVRSFEGEAGVPRYRERLEEAVHGETVPLFGPAFVDRRQRLWISESIFPDFDGLPRRWSVFGLDGAWLGDVEVPEGLRIVDATEDRVLGIWSDALDVDYVQVHRFTPSTDGETM